MADPAQFFQGNGDLASKRLPSAAPPSAGLTDYLQRFGGGPAASAPVSVNFAPGNGNLATKQLPYVAPLQYGDLAAHNALATSYRGTPAPAPAPAPAPGLYAYLGGARSPSPQDHAAVAANALAAANGAPRAHSISVEYGGNPNPRVFNFNADGSPVHAAAMPKLDFSQMTPGQLANAYMQPSAPHKAMRDAYAMSGLNNPHAQMAGRYYDLVTKLSASGIDPLNLPKGSLVASELAALREGMSAGYYQTDRTLGTGMPQ